MQYQIKFYQDENDDTEISLTCENKEILEEIGLKLEQFYKLHNGKIEISKSR